MGPWLGVFSNSWTTFKNLLETHTRGGGSCFVITDSSQGHHPRATGGTGSCVLRFHSAQLTLQPGMSIQLLLHLFGDGKVDTVDTRQASHSVSPKGKPPMYAGLREDFEESEVRTYIPPALYKRPSHPAYTHVAKMLLSVPGLHLSSFLGSRVYGADTTHYNKPNYLHLNAKSVYQWWKNIGLV